MYIFLNRIKNSDRNQASDSYPPRALVDILRAELICLFYFYKSIDRSKMNQRSSGSATTKGLNNHVNGRYTLELQRIKLNEKKERLIGSILSRSVENPPSELHRNLKIIWKLSVLMFVMCSECRISHSTVMKTMMEGLSIHHQLIWHRFWSISCHLCAGYLWIKAKEKHLMVACNAFCIPQCYSPIKCF